MARRPRIEYPGALYHVITRGNHRQKIFYDDDDRAKYLELMAHLSAAQSFRVHAYVLMPNHLVIETPDGNLSKGMRQLNGVYTQAFNRRHRRVGHLFQGRFKGILVQKERHFLEVCRYVVLNPVRAKAVSRPREWRWSSYRATAGFTAPPKALTMVEMLDYFGRRKATAQEKYRRYVQEGIAQNSIWENLEAQSLLGVEGFAEALRPHVSGKVKMKEIPKGQRLMGRPSLDKLFQKTEASKASRDRAIAEAVSKYGYGQIEVAQYLKLHYATISRLVKSALDARA
jgi:putative transposase